MHRHIGSPKYEIVDKQPQGVQEVDQDQMPVPLEVDQDSAVFLAVVRKILMNLR